MGINKGSRRTIICFMTSVKSRDISEKTASRLLAIHKIPSSKGREKTILPKM